MIADNAYEVAGEDYLMPNSFVERKFTFALTALVNSVDIVIRLLFPNIPANDEREVVALTKYLLKRISILPYSSQVFALPEASAEHGSLGFSTSTSTSGGGGGDSSSSSELQDSTGGGLDDGGNGGGGGDSSVFWTAGIDYSPIRFPLHAMLVPYGTQRMIIEKLLLLLLLLFLK
jgi:hypothetical protein